MNVEGIKDNIRNSEHRFLGDMKMYFTGTMEQIRLVEY